jgi:uncharacterized membrane protein YdbT with pleckstrin-like domain
VERGDAGLQPGEQLIFRTRLHPVMFSGTVGFTAFVTAIAALIIARNELAGDTIALLCLAAAVVVVSAWVSPLLRWRASEFAVTSRRLIVRGGLLRAYTLDFPLPEVREVAVEETLGGRLLDYGTVEVVRTKGEAEAFPRVAQAKALRDAAKRQRRK